MWYCCYPLLVWLTMVDDASNLKYWGREAINISTQLTLDVNTLTVGQLGVVVFGM